MQYRAFISHSHTDAKFAAWLQRAIETWRVPTRLRPELGFNRVKPVFRDRTDLRAATSLGDALEDALRNSSALIIVCSNEAARSDWVGQEVAQYRKFNPDAPILPIIASGEPPYCFPESLLVDASGNASEPLAADARKNFDGKRDALLKVIAGIIDVDFDELKQRDFRRRQQKMGALTALSMGIAAFTLYLAFVANEARDDANRRREQADELITFMLGDLRDKLEPIGKLDVLGAIGEEAIGYYASLESDEFTADVLVSQGKALRQIGEVQYFLGEYDEARNTLEKSLEILNRVEQGSGTSFEVLFEISQSEFWIGYGYFEQGMQREATRYFLLYVERAEQLLEMDPESITAHRELSYALTNLAALQMDLSNYDDARDTLERARFALDGLASVGESKEELLSMKSHLESWLGEVEYLEGNLTKALQHYTAESWAASELIKTRENMDDKEVLAYSIGRAGVVYGLLGDFKASRDAHAQSLSLSTELVENDAENAWWQKAFVSSSSQLAMFHGFFGDTNTALSILENARPIFDVLLGDKIENSDFQLETLNFLHAQAMLMARTGSLENASERLSVSLSQIVSVKEAPRDADWRQVAAKLWMLHGDIQLVQNSAESAENYWSRGLAYLALEGDIKRGPEWLLVKFELSSRLGNKQIMDSLYARLVKAGVNPALAGSFYRFDKTIYSDLGLANVQK
ncbi:MAG: toll/interleukin-1 receptor domain-containing protein [Halioglobus sp.]